MLMRTTSRRMLTREGSRPRKLIGRYHSPSNGSEQATRPHEWKTESERWGDKTDSPRPRDLVSRNDNDFGTAGKMSPAYACAKHARSRNGARISWVRSSVLFVTQSVLFYELKQATTPNGGTTLRLVKL